MADPLHEEGVQLALEFLREKGLEARLSVWIGMTAPNGLGRTIRVDAAGLLENELKAVVEVGGVANGWYFALAPLIEMYHWPVISGYGLKSSLAPHPHYFGSCSECPPVHEPGFRFLVGNSMKEAMGVVTQLKSLHNELLSRNLTP